MTRIQFAKPKSQEEMAAEAPPRRNIVEILGLPNAPSPAGSTFHRRARGCPREHALVTIARLSPMKESEALTVGLLVHWMLENYYKQRMLGASHVLSERAAFDCVGLLRTEAGYEKTFETISRVVAAYFARYRTQDNWRVIAIEETLYVNRPFEYSCRLDLLIEDLDVKKMFIVETKTARAITEVLLEGYQLDLQILGQVYTFMKTVDLRKYPPFGGVIINLMNKGKDPRFERPTVMPSRYHLAAFEDQGKKWQKLLPIIADHGYPQDFSKCSGFSRGYTRCQFFNLCHAFPNHTVEEMAEGVPPFGYERRDIHDIDSVTET